MKGWEIVEHPQRQQRYTVWHLERTGEGCPVYRHVHRFTDMLRQAEAYVENEEQRLAVKAGKAIA